MLVDIFLLVKFLLKEKSVQNIIGYWLPVTGDWLLVIGYWFLIISIGYRLLVSVVGYRLLVFVIGKCTLSRGHVQKFLEQPTELICPLSQFEFQGQPECSASFRTLTELQSHLASHLYPFCT